MPAARECSHVARRARKWENGTVKDASDSGATFAVPGAIRGDRTEAWCGITCTSTPSQPAMINIQDSSSLKPEYTT